MPGTLCVETDAGGRQRVYRLHSGVDKGSGKMWEGFDMVRMRMHGFGRHSCFLPGPRWQQIFT
jgi:hypothetical protein